jgi:lipoyl(octanoyl) transferase
VDFASAWQIQQLLHTQVANGEIGTQVLFAEHNPVYTAGRHSLAEELPKDGTPVVSVNRGGKTTWHGPGQLVGYPLMFIPQGIGAVDYVRRIEEALMRVLLEYGLACGQVPGRTGVWLPPNGANPLRKIAAIGVRIARQTTLQGFALNVDNDLSPFSNIIPCGISDAPVTSMAVERDGAAPPLVEIATLLEAHLSELLRFEPAAAIPDDGLDYAGV